MNKQSIIELLLQYLPQISLSLSKIVSSLRVITETDSPENTDELSVIMAELLYVLPIMSEVVNEIDFNKVKDKASLGDIEICLMYLDSFKKLISGIKCMLEWIDNDEPEEKFHQSINLLFEAGQEITALVNKITNDK